MAEGINQEPSLREEKTCRDCLFYYCDEENQTDKCMRFSRFVDHVITAATKNCSYWTDRNDG